MALTLLRIRSRLRQTVDRVRLACRAMKLGRPTQIDHALVRTVTRAGEAADGSDFVYAPRLTADRLDDDALRNARLGLSHHDYDFLLFSRTLTDLPLVRVPEDLLQSVIFRNRAQGYFLDGAIPSSPLCGRVVRMPGLAGSATDTQVERLFPRLSVRVEGAEIVLGRGRTRAVPPATPTRFEVKQTSPTRPSVFVWPALWAVGGVERLAIEVMRRLRDRYEFVVVTTERLTPGQGSLHHELKTLEVATYDLGEIGPPESHLAMLAALKDAYRPVVVWLCNGSPWLCDHAAEIRRAYADVPIVAQIAYDTRVGWINRYHETGIRSFDRHIAINRNIERCLVEEKRLDPRTLDLIYHAYDESRFNPGLFPPKRVSALRQASGFPPDERLFVFVGRMTAQKRPLDFAYLAECADEGPPAWFLMVGDGDLAGEVDRAVHSVKSGRLRRLPFSDHVPEILAMADGLIITSEFEGLPIAMLEALAMGVPVLATDVGEIRAVLEESGAGTVVAPPGDRTALLRAFHAFRARLPELREAAALAAPSFRERFGGQRVAAQYEECWRRAIVGKSNRKTSQLNGA